MSSLESILDVPAIAGLLGLASAAAGGAPIGLVDVDGSHVAGGEAESADARRHAVAVGGTVVGAVVARPDVPPELLALVARSIELALGGEHEHAESVRVSQELAIGRRIQLALLPRRFPDVPGWAFAAAYEPAREVGGDLYDVFPLRGRTDRIGILIADVTGKGIPAALLMADVRALLHAAADNADGPADALGRVNRILVRERATSLFVTAALMVIDTTTGRIAYAAAGHDPALIARCQGGVPRLDASGPILGAFEDATFEERAATLERGDCLVLYTDGVTEARSESRHFFGEDRLLRVVSSACGWTADAIARTVIDDVASFRGTAEPFDDLTLLVVERQPAAV